MGTDERDTLPIWVIYRHHRDFPAHYVARCWHMDTLTEKYLIGRDLDAVRDLLPEGLVQLDRSDKDDPTIVEVWL